MKIDEIVRNLQALEPTAPAAKKKSKPKAVAAAPAVKPNGHSALDPGEMLRVTAQRIAAALQVESVTAESIVQAVETYERQAYQGMVQ